MTNSEKLMEFFSQLYYYQALRLEDLCYFPQTGESAEADLIVNLGDIAVVLKYISGSSPDTQSGEKWLADAGKQAKLQIRTLIADRESGKFPLFLNRCGKKIKFADKIQIFPLLIFDNEGVPGDYCRLIDKEDENDIYLSCTSIEGFEEICTALVTPVEIMHYIYYREVFYGRRLSMDSVDRQKADQEDFGTRGPCGKEPVLRLFLTEKLGYQGTNERRFRLEEFRDFLQKFPNHFNAGQNNCSVEDVILFMAHLNREEATSFIERMMVLVEETLRNTSGMLSSLRPKDDRYAIFFVAKEVFPIPVIREMISQKNHVRKIMEVVAHKATESTCNLEFLLVNV